MFKNSLCNPVCCSFQQLQCMINNLLCNTTGLVDSLQQFSQRSLTGIWEAVMSGFRLTSGIFQKSSQPEVFAFWSQHNVASGPHSGFLGTAEAGAKTALCRSERAGTERAEGRHGYARLYIRRTQCCWPREHLGFSLQTILTWICTNMARGPCRQKRRNGRIA